MQFTFKRVTHFSRLLKAGGRLREFNFRKLTDLPEDGWFHIDVADDRGERLMFRVFGDGTVVKTTDLPFPVWVDEALPPIRQIISHPDEYES